MSQFYVSDPLKTLFQVPLSDLPVEWVKKVHKLLDLGWEKNPDSKKYLLRKPTAAEVSLFRAKMEAMASFKVRVASGIEALAMQGEKSPTWNGTRLTVGTDVYNYRCVPHVDSASLPPKDEFPVVVTTMLLKKEGDSYTKSMAESVITDGPLSAVMSSVSYLEFVEKVTPMLKDLKVQSKGELMAKELYEGLAAKPPAYRRSLRMMVYDLFSEAEIRVDPVTLNLNMSTGFDVDDSQDIEVMKDQGQIVAYVPTFVPKRVTRSIDIFPSKELKDKNALSSLVSHVGSRFPPTLCKFYGFRGMPVKHQREYMILRQMFQGKVVMVEADTMTKKWMIANGEGSRIRTRDTALVSGDLQPGDLQLQKYDYTGPLEMKAPGILWGTIKFSVEFWKSYKVISYRLDPLGRFFYCPQSLDLTFLAKDWNAWPLSISTTEVDLQKLYADLAAELVTAVFRGSYLAHPGQYKGLKYPVMAKEYINATAGALADLDMDIGDAQPTKKPAPRYVITPGKLVDDDEVSVVIDDSNSSIIPEKKAITVPSAPVPVVPKWKTHFLALNPSDYPNYDFVFDCTAQAEFLFSVPSYKTSSLLREQFQGCDYVMVQKQEFLIVGYRRDEDPSVLAVLSPDGIAALEKAIHAKMNTVSFKGKIVEDDDD